MSLLWKRLEIVIHHADCSSAKGSKHARDVPEAVVVGTRYDLETMQKDLQATHCSGPFLVRVDVHLFA